MAEQTHRTLADNSKTLSSDLEQVFQRHFGELRGGRDCPLRHRPSLERGPATICWSMCFISWPARSSPTPCFRAQNLAASAGLHWMNNVLALVTPTVPGQPTVLAPAIYTIPSTWPAAAACSTL